MGQLVRKGVTFGGSISSAEELKYDDTKNVKEAIDERATSTDLESHINNIEAHITEDERTAWNAAEGNANSYTDNKIATVNENLAERNLKTYTSVSQIDESYTMANFMYGNIPQGATLMCRINNSNVSDSYNNGLIPVNKTGELYVRSAGMGHIEFHANDGNSYYANVYFTNITKNSDIAWKSYATNSDLSAINENLGKKFDKTGGTLSGDVRIDKTASTDTARMSVCSKTKELRLIAEESGICGLYDATNGKYIVMEDTDGSNRINGNLYVSDGTNAGKVSVSSPTRHIILNAQTEAQGGKAGLYDGTAGKWLLFSDNTGIAYTSAFAEGIGNPWIAGQGIGMRAPIGTATQNAFMQIDYDNKIMYFGISGLGMNALTVNKAANSFNDHMGNNIASTYAKKSELGAVQIKQIQLVTTNNISVSGTNNVSVTVDISGYKFTGTVRAFLKANKYCTGHADVSADKKTLTVECYGVGVDTTKAQLSFYLVETTA